MSNMAKHVKTSFKRLATAVLNYLLIIKFDL